MQLVINTRGSYLRKKENRFLVRNDDKVFEVSANKVESILIATSAYISTDAIKFAVENNIEIVFIDYNGNPYGRVWHSKLGSTTLIRRRQLEIYDKDEGLKLAKIWSVKKIENQIDLLKRLKQTRPEMKEEFGAYIERIEEMKDNLKGLKGSIDEGRNTILGIEGMSSKIYFEAVNFVMPQKFKFDGRSRQPARDEFNAMLNYGYGVLYSMVERSCILAGLDPYIGFLHTDNYNKKSFVFDLIEIFRTWVDETVIFLFTKRKVKKDYFDEINDGVSLNKEGRTLLIGALNETFDKTVRYKGRNVKVRNIIQSECHGVANRLIKGG
jgi:CRISPR-associated protein Cas1